MESKRTYEGRITGAASIIGAATVLSRILGYVRDAVIAFAFGAGLYSDAFFMAFRITNLMRRLLGDGALTSSFVPIFTEEMNTRTMDEARGLVTRIFSMLIVILVPLSIIGIIFSSQLVWLMSPGFTSDPEKFSITVNLTRIMFPYMIFVGLMAVAMGILNSFKYFTAPAISPVFFNLSLIFSVLVLARFFTQPVYALAVGVLLGGAAQFLLQVPYLKRYGMIPGGTLSFKDPAIKKIFILMGPAAFGVGVYQLNIFVTTWFASRLADGSISYLYYAGRIMELPLGVFGVAISTAALPSLSEYVVEKDWDMFKSTISFSIRIVNFVMIPATVGLLALSSPVIDILFRRGEFHGVAAAGTAAALYYYAIGLVPVSVSRILMSGFYSLKDTITPVYVALVSFIFNVILCFILIGPLKHGGLALATSLSAAINAGLLLLILKRRLGKFGGRLILGSAIRSGGASFGMGLIVCSIVYSTGLETMSAGLKSALIMLILIAAVIAYLLLARVFKAPEITFLKGILKKSR